MEIIISNNSDKPIYEQITLQIKAMIMNNKLKSGAPLPSMRGLAKSLRISVITAQRAYEDLQKDGFIKTVPGKGCFVAKTNRDFFVEEQLKKIEDYLLQATDLAKMHDIKVEKLVELMYLFYEEGK